MFGADFPLIVTSTRAHVLLASDVAAVPNAPPADSFCNTVDGGSTFRAALQAPRKAATANAAKTVRGNLGYINIHSTFQNSRDH